MALRRGGKQFSGSDAGCIADDALGHEYVRRKLVQCLLCLPASASAQRDPLIVALEDTASDDAWEEHATIDLLI